LEFLIHRLAEYNFLLPYVSPHYKKYHTENRKWNQNIQLTIPKKRARQPSGDVIVTVYRWIDAASLPHFTRDTRHNLQPVKLLREALSIKNNLHGLFIMLISGYSNLYQICYSSTLAIKQVTLRPH
jgi:hypothetical protein